ncbi:PREDICTED: tetratricopeptide repeat protein 1 [Camelina sativa]|uniref:Tetratricopeptide repeat protein 1 n=1 Tax=Camelina sativa TaxID=90675 RepID=A0ABM0UA58_CAMSA|nr:PREDICTED: tetratricopeptide repeat protein 1 [Camelina sativa]
MVLIESSESEDEILIKTELKPSSSSSPQQPTETKQVDGDDSDGFETASEREISDEEGEEDGTKNDDVTSQEEKPQHSEKKEEQVELMSGGEAITDDGSNKEKAMAEANEAKAEGNKLFVNGLYEEALSKYAFALELVKEFPESIELRSICHLNSGVCFLKLAKYEETIKECTKALELNPSYTKALVRRAEAHEKLEHFEDAVTDLKKILELDPSSDHARKGIRRLEPLAAEKREKMKEEAITKLKEMGNSILGRFGMSVDNFKAVKDPNTGSYSLSFQN